MKLETLKNQHVELSAFNKISSGVTSDIFMNIANRLLAKTGNLASKRKLKTHS